MYEHRSQPLVSREAFRSRVFRHVILAAGFILAALAIGVLGYRAFEGMAWIDALLNASMILGGMGPVGELHRSGAKLFASFYALFSGVVFLASASVIMAPVVHRFLHRFHAELPGGPSGRSRASQP